MISDKSLFYMPLEKYFSGGCRHPCPALQLTRYEMMSLVTELMGKDGRISKPLRFCDWFIQTDINSKTVGTLSWLTVEFLASAYDKGAAQ